MFIILTALYLGSALGFIKPISSVELMMLASFMIAIFTKQFRSAAKFFSQSQN